jgi:hypothetical protein
MKTLTAILLTLAALSSKAQSDSMIMIDGRIYINRIEITTKEAKEYARESNAESYRAFQKANRMKNWNAVWAIMAGLNIGVGAHHTLVHQRPTGVLSLMVGSGLAFIPANSKRIQTEYLYIKEGVESYNK